MIHRIRDATLLTGGTPMSGTEETQLCVVRSPREISVFFPSLSDYRREKRHDRIDQQDGRVTTQCRVGLVSQGDREGRCRSRQGGEGVGEREGDVAPPVELICPGCSVLRVFLLTF